MEDEELQGDTFVQETKTNALEKGGWRSKSFDETVNSLAIFHQTQRLMCIYCQSTQTLTHT